MEKKDEEGRKRAAPHLQRSKGMKICSAAFVLKELDLSHLNKVAKK